MADWTKNRQYGGRQWMNNKLGISQANTRTELGEGRRGEVETLETPLLIVGWSALGKPSERPAGETWMDRRATAGSVGGGEGDKPRMYNEKEENRAKEEGRCTGTPPCCPRRCADKICMYPRPHWGSGPTSGGLGGDESAAGRTTLFEVIPNGTSIRMAT
ncbi:hypothetical protein I7I53_01645 [Histoplasma capsulatum var. duboisii H88]|uniref:Uncharacterized protein n=1 Tax=Ajellomyces capsulatus (strain H88) TaxID=544711 RepID=A0A8A1LIF8_AJEC8|nr:hypothetical protein I7I53_01645 [Histoplasma capsulatum var. duboisii H88]